MLPQVPATRINVQYFDSLARKAAATADLTASQASILADLAASAALRRSAMCSDSTEALREIRASKSLHKYAQAVGVGHACHVWGRGAGVPAVGQGRWGGARVVGAPGVRLCFGQGEGRRGCGFGVGCKVAG